MSRRHHRSRADGLPARTGTTIAFAAIAVAAILLSAHATPQRAAPNVSVVVDHNAASAATRLFKFTRVPSPVTDDAAAKAVVEIVDGEIDPNSGGLGGLTDGLLPRDEDEPGANFFFNAGTVAGTFRMDLGAPREIAEIHTYSWHPNTRGPQVYAVYASDGAAPGFDRGPKARVDPATVGWTWIANVDTRPAQGDGGGQYGVSLSKPGGTLGKFRYLLFVCAITESDDDYGHTFFSEIDVK